MMNKIHRWNKQNSMHNFFYRASLDGTRIARAAPRAES
jgi:hypothetical protein